MQNASPIRRCVGRVERRLFVGRVLAVWPWTATAAFSAAAVVIAVDKFRPLGVVASTALMVAAAASVVGALAWSWLRRNDTLAAAVELDRRCGLAERVSSAVALTSASDEPLAEAVRADAERVLSKVDVAASFPLLPSRRAAWPLLPALAVVAIALSLAPSDPIADPATAADVAARAQVKESTDALAKKLAEKKRTAEELKLTEAQHLLEKLEEETQRLKTDGRLDQKEALVKLNDLAKQLEERRKEVDGAEALQKQLNRLRSSEAGPAEKLAQALGKGDFRAASDQLQQLREQLKSDKLDSKQKEQLAKQLDEMQQQLDDLARKQEERRQDAERKMAQGLKSKSSGEGRGASADELAQLSEQLAAASSDDQQLERLQKALQGAADGMQQGRSDDAQQALNDLQDQLNDLAAQNDERQLLDQGLQDLAECKAGCCRGEGQGDGRGNAGRGPGGRQQNGNQGQQANSGQGGLKPGVGTANNENPTIEDDKSVYDTRVRTQVGEGALRVVGPTDGPNAKGRALQLIREQAEALADGAEPQPVANQPLDRSRRAQKRQYFDTLRQGE